MAPRLLLATDGLWKYAPHDRIAEAARVTDLERAADELSALVRHSNSTFHDDVAFALVPC